MPGMGPAELVRRALNGLDTPRPALGPLAVHFCARVAGVSLRDYTLNPGVLADSAVRYYERFHPDAVWLSADTWVNAQAMGASVSFPCEGQPLGGTGEPFIRRPKDIRKIPAPDPSSQGRWPLMIDALQRIRKSLGPEAFVVACFDQYPFSLACALMGLENMMVKVIEDPPMAEALMEKCSEYTLAYARALTDAGADMLSGGDSPAGLLGPELYRRFALPYEQRIASQLKTRLSLPVSLHICGDTTLILRDLAASGADVLELDHRVDISEACGIVGPGMALWGNLDPVALLAQGTPQQVRQACRALVQDFHNSGHTRFVISSGCTLAVETPFENLSAMINAAREA